jgi:hypothetical protein
MVDYYPVISRAVAEAADSGQRRQIYQCARDALLKQLRGGKQATEAEITRERLALEDAIRRVEAETMRRARRAPPNVEAAASPARPVPAKPVQTAGQVPKPPAAPPTVSPRSFEPSPTVRPPARPIEPNAATARHDVRSIGTPQDARAERGVVRRVTRTLALMVQGIRRSHARLDMPRSKELLKQKLGERGFDAARLSGACLEQLANSTIRYASRKAQVDASRIGAAEISEALDETASEIVDCLQRDHSAEFLDVKEALFADEKQALFAEVKEALERYGIAGSRKQAASDARRSE